MTVLGNLGRLNETYSTGRFEYIYMNFVILEVE